MKIDKDSNEAIFGWLERRRYGVEKRVALGSVPCRKMVECATVKSAALKQKLGTHTPAPLAIRAAFSELRVKDATAVADKIRAYQMGMSARFVPEDVEMGWRPARLVEPESEL